MHTIAAPRRYSIITPNKLANTLYFHLILDHKSILEALPKFGKRTP